MAILNKDQILNAQDLKRVEVPVPEWGDEEATVLVQELTGADRNEIEQFAMKYKNLDAPPLFRPRVCCLAIIDEDGNKVFDWDDAEMLARKNATVIERIYTAVAELSGLRPDRVDELEQDLSSGQRDGSTSA